jgi:hypothetical protein
MRKPGLTFEYLLSVVLVCLVIGLYFVAFLTLGTLSGFIIGLFSSLLGAFLVPFGFWGADFAFDAVRRGEKYVYVPFLGRTREKGTEAAPDLRGRNYTPLEWWNLNWLIVTLGVALLCAGLFAIGYTVGTGLSFKPG